MNDYIWHDQLHSRHHISGHLKVESPLRISSGVASDETDAPFIRDIAERRYIPGPSLRGAIRAELERVICGIGADASGIRTCTLFSENDCAKVLKDKIKIINENSDEKSRHRAMENLIETEVCDMCRLFGNTMFASRIFFKDGRFEQNQDKGIIRDGVGIDRDTGAAAPTVKYDYEVIDPGGEDIRFSFDVTVENATVVDKKTLHLMLQLLTNGIFIGGKRSGGMGCVKLCEGVIVTGFEDPLTGWDLIITGKQAPRLTTSEKPWKEVFPC